MSDRMNDLRDEAKDLSESFSPSLHARVMAKVRAQATPVATRQIHPFRYALAAAAMVAIALAAWVLTRPAIQPPTPGPKIVKRFGIPNLLPQVAIALNDDGGNPAYAYLDHDAKAFGKFVVKQLDVMPSLK